MTDNIPEWLLSDLSVVLARRMGLRFPENRLVDLERGITRAAPELGFQKPVRCAEWLLKAELDREQVQTLARRLTINETYFMREERSFAILREKVIPDMLAARRDGDRRLRLWSAGCSTGEEAYSLAMLLDGLLGDWDEWNITIRATDINPAALEKARAGVYSDWSFRGTPEWLRTRYFTRTRSNRYRVVPHIRRRVEFAYVNLAADPYPAIANDTNGIDLILCRNVLMYFSPEGTAQVIDKLHRCLVEGGWFLVSATEVPIVEAGPFARVSFPDATFFRKESPVSRPGLQAPHALPALGTASASDSEPFFFEDIGSEEPDIGVDSFVDAFAHEVASSETQNRPISSRPERPSGPLSLAEELCADGRYGEAADVLDVALGSDSLQAQSRVDATELLARAHANMGHLPQARDMASEAVELDSLQPRLHYLLASVQMELQEDDEALAELRRAIFLDQTFILAHFAMGMLLRRMGRSARAYKSLRNALALLDGYGPEDVLPESEGLTAGRLREIAVSVIGAEVAQ